MSPLKNTLSAGLLGTLLAVSATSPQAAGQPRARDLGIPFVGTPGPQNAITDVKGVTVGYATLIEGEGKLEIGKGPIRTGVTAILPRGKHYDPVFAGWYSFNGNGEMTGTTWVEESGFLEGPVLITNTHSAGLVRDSTIAWQADNDMVGPTLFEDLYFLLPVVAETYDGILNDINGMHVKKEHVYAALDSAAPGRVAEGNVGGGTGMALFGFKGGTGTASRQLSREQGGYTVGVLLQGNFGTPDGLMIAGVPVGREIRPESPLAHRQPPQETGSVIVIVATDAPLLPHQLKRLARRVPVGLARTGGYGGNGSGEIFLAFSTANPGAFSRKDDSSVQMVSNDTMDPLIEATALATEEAVINAMVAAETMVGRDGYTLQAIPHDRLQAVMKKYQRLAP
ncbi:P1 family peptidase [Castellaniella hirudinis]|uniref:P1 family peptidase n=1 Tax=Castellaniella hirudinis TaxID=1144617 RepID=A0ABV8RZ63_9BURK